MTTPLDKGCMAMEISSAVTDLVNDVKGMSEHKLAEAIQHLINATAEQTAGNLYRGSSAEPDASGLIAAADIFEQASDMAAMKAADLEIHGTQQFGINALSNLASELKDKADALRTRAADRSAPRSDKGGA